MKWVFPFDILRFLVRYSIFDIRWVGACTFSLLGKERGSENRLSLMRMGRNPALLPFR